jgi:hypothetical protein
LAGSKISGTITSTVTLGTGLYVSPLTVTGSGLIAPANYGATGILLPKGQTGISTLVNEGRIFGGNGAYGFYGGGIGGYGIYANSAIHLVNAGTIAGGAGGASGATGEYFGGEGEDAVVIATSQASTMSNTGLVIGGAGGSSRGGGGLAGDGMFVDGVSVAVSNSGIIRGGAGGYGYFYGGTSGGNGVSGFSGSIFNSGSIEGGAGGASYVGNGGRGGRGAFFEDVVLTNTGIITGGAGAFSVNGLGGDGGEGVLIYGGGTLINDGIVSGGAGGAGYSGGGAMGDAVYSIDGTVVAQDNAVFIGTVFAKPSYKNVLEVAGTSGVVLAGIGTQFTNFTEIAFAQGATRGIEGNIAAIASGQTIAGFAAGDMIVLDGFVAGAAEVGKTGLILEQLETTAGVDETLALGGSLTGDFIGHFAGGNTTLTTAASTNGLVLKSGFENVTTDGMATATTIGAEASLIVAYGGVVQNAVIDTGALAGLAAGYGMLVTSGGSAIGTVLDSNSRAEIVGGSMTGTTIDKNAVLNAGFGAVVSNTTIAGGTLIDAATATGYIDFKGKGGVLDIAKPPAAVISGFAAGDQIVFDGTPYAAGDKVSVKKAGDVTVTLNGVGVDLAIAGAKKGETDFKLSSGTDGATLTLKGGKTAAMKFLAPPPAIISGGTALPSLASVMSSPQKPAAAANLWVASALPPQAPIQDLIRIPHGGIQTMLTLQSGS